MVAGQVDKINSEMRRLNLPDELKKKIHTYYEYLWIHKQFGAERLVEDPDLSAALKKEVMFVD